MSVGQALGAVAGAVIGFFMGGPAGAAKGAYVGYTLGTLADPPPGPNIQGPRLSDLVTQTSVDGAPLARVYGSARIAGNVIWTTGLEEIATTTEQGGGSGGGGATTTSYSYKADLAVALCEGEITGVRRIWADTKLIYDMSETADVASVVASGGRAADIRVYTGSETQDPDPLIQAVEGTANAPAFLGTAYVVFEDLQLADFGNRIPNFTFEVVTGGSLSASTVTSSGRIGTSTHLYGSYAVDSDRILSFWYAYPYIHQHGLMPVSGNNETRSFIPVQTWLGTAWQQSGGSYTTIACNQSGVALVGVEGYFYYGGQWQGGVLLYRNYGGIDGFSETPIDCAYAALGGGPGSGGGSIAIRDLETYVFTTDRYSSLYLFIRGGKYPLSTGGNAVDGPIMFARFYSDRFVVGRPANGAATITHVYWYDYSGNLIETKTSFSVSSRGAIVGDTLYQVVSGGYYVTTGMTSLAELGTSTYVPVSGMPTLYSAVYYGIGFPGVIASGGVLQIADLQRWFVSMGGLAARSSATLQSICENLAEDAGLASSKYSFSSLSADSVHGYVVARPMSARAAIEPLQQAYHFDLVEIDGQIKAIKRGNASALTFTADDLGAAEQPGSDLVQSVRNNETELPSEVQITYADFDNDYQPGTQYARRITAEHTHISTLNLAIVMTSTEAARVADVLLNEAWHAGRYSHTWTATYEHARLTPTDVVTLPAWGESSLARITGIDMGAPGLVQITAVPELAGLYTSTVTGSDAAGISQSISLAGPTQLALLDCVMLRDEDTAGGWYVGQGGYMAGWPGAVLYKSSDSGATWSQAISTVRANGITQGYATTTLATADCRAMDRANTVTVQLSTGTLSSTTEANLLNGGNAALLGAAGRWELIQYQTATLNVDGTYTLSDLLRGRRGTEYAASSHAAYDRFISLASPAALQDLPAPTSEIGASRQFKAVTSGKMIEDVSAETQTYTGERLECLAPVLLGGGRDASGNLTINWVRRDRINAGWNNYSDVPMSEARESYEVEIYTSNTYATLKRTLTGITSATTSYSSANQVTDFGSNQATVYVRVYQLSATVGRGHYLQGAI